jgi:two-component sensor histidine kinase
VVIRVIIILFVCTLTCKVNASPVLSESDSMEIVRLLNLAEKEDRSKALAYALKSLTIAKKLNNAYLLAKTYCQLTYLYRQERKEMVFYYDSLYLLYAKASKNNDLQFDALQLTIKDYLNVNKLNSAEKYLGYFDSLMINNSNENQLCVTEQVKSFYFTKKFKPRDALKHAWLSWTHAEKIQDQLLKGRSLNHIADSYAYLFKNDSAAIYYFEALKVFNLLGDKYELGNCYSSIAFVNQTSANFPAALQYYRNAEVAFKSAGFIIDAAYVNFQVAEIYFALKKTDSAGMVIKKATSEFENARFNQGKALGYLYLSRYYKLTNQKDSATYFQELANRKLVNEDNTLLDFFGKGHEAVMKIQDGDIAGGEEMAKQLTVKMPGIFTKEVLASASAKIALRKDSLMPINSLSGKLTNGDTSEIVMDNTLINPFTGTNTSLDSILSIKVQRQVAEIEARFRVKEAKDSMQLAQKEGLLLAEKVRRRNLILIFSVVLLMALFTLLMLVNKSRKRANREKERAKEDELIIKHLRDELDHRVDNTLNNISAIIRMVKDKSDDIGSFSLLEQKIDPLITLYKILKENQSANILLQEYFEQLCSGLKSFYDHQDKIEILVDAPIEIPGNKAGRLGLILNELVTNSFKHAFKGDGKGRISVSCFKDDFGQYCLTVGDSGSGMMAGGNSQSRKGLKLVKVLAHELQAKIIEKEKNGVSFEFYFF